VKEIKKQVQWDLKVADSVKALEPPSRKELETLRNRVDPRGMFLREARLLKEKDILF
jgi:hypothetical protein